MLHVFVSFHSCFTQNTPLRTGIIAAFCLPKFGRATYECSMAHVWKRKVRNNKHVPQGLPRFRHKKAWKKWSKWRTQSGKAQKGLCQSLRPHKELYHIYVQKESNRKHIKVIWKHGYELLGIPKIAGKENNELLSIERPRNKACSAAHEKPDTSTEMTSRSWLVEESMQWVQWGDLKYFKNNTDNWGKT